MTRAQATGEPTTGQPTTGTHAAGFDLDRRWALHPQVAVRPERFGALLYHFGTRRLSFLKDRRLLTVVQRLDGAGSARAACTAAGVGDAELARFATALGSLAATDMIIAREAP